MIKFNGYSDTITLHENETICGCELRPLKYINYDGEGDYDECAIVTPEELENGEIPDLWSVYILSGDASNTEAQLIADCETKEGAEELLRIFNIFLNPLTVTKSKKVKQ